MAGCLNDIIFEDKHDKEPEGGFQLMELKIFKGYERFMDDYPFEAVKYALENSEEAIPELLEILEYTIADAENLSKDQRYLIHIPAMYLLAYFREPRAYESIIKIARLPREQIFDLLGDIVTDSFRNILASVCDGNINPIKGIIEEPLFDENVRTAALESLVVLLNHDLIRREELVFYFKKIFNGKIEVDHSSLWDTLPSLCSMIQPSGLKKDIEKAVADGKVMEHVADLYFMNQQLKRPVKEVLDELKENIYYLFISKEDLFALQDFIEELLYELNDEDGYYDWEDWEYDTELFYSANWEKLVEYRYNKAERYPDDPDSQCSLAEAYVFNKEYEKAINLLSDLIKDYPEDLNIQYTLLDALVASGKDETAVKWIVKPDVLKLDQSTLDRCYEFLKNKRKPRNVLEVHLELYKYGYMVFDADQLMAFMHTDERFLLTGSPTKSYDCYVSLNMKSKK
jgi:hypothetical protein